MKINFYAVFCLLAVIFVGCNNSQKKVKSLEITPFIESCVILTDTTPVKKVFISDSGSSMHDYNLSHGQEYFLNEVQFNEFIKMVSAMLNDPKSKIYFSDTPASRKEIRERIVIQPDSIEISQFDNQGNEYTILTAAPADSTTAFSSIRQICFYESWRLNPQNNIIEKNVLGYSVIQYNEEKGFYGTFFSVFKDEEAHQTYKKFKRE